MLAGDGAAHHAEGIGLAGGQGAVELSQVPVKILVLMDNVGFFPLVFR